MDLEILTWEQVKPVWDTSLWPGRNSEPVTSMKYLGGYDMGYKREEPRFVGFINDSEEIVAVNSYVLTTITEWRSRGLWVHPKHRGHGYARDMLQYMIDDIKSMGGRKIWTMPRRGALEAYEASGFTKTSEWEKHEWGVNCYARIYIK